ncbi:hypothetical protein BGZ63DRAFT_146065 [Mariannaea sp. PMI_226]|nr:hypothetical protein BGZ63DRAFT_146065 [Mariannaea sp. PMI_226]
MSIHMYRTLIAQVFQSFRCPSSSATKSSLENVAPHVSLLLTFRFLDHQPSSNFLAGHGSISLPLAHFSQLYLHYGALNHFNDVFIPSHITSEREGEKKKKKRTNHFFHIATTHLLLLVGIRPPYIRSPPRPKQKVLVPHFRHWANFCSSPLTLTCHGPCQSRLLPSTPHCSLISAQLSLTVSSVSCFSETWCVKVTPDQLPCNALVVSPRLRSLAIHLPTCPVPGCRPLRVLLKPPPGKKKLSNT